MKKEEIKKNEMLRPKELPSFDELRIFVEAWEAIVEARARNDRITSIRQLSLALGISHVSMQDNLNRIESKYKTKLIERDTFTLTESGESVFQWAYKVVSMYREGEEVQQKTEALDMTIGIGRYPSTVIISSFIASLSRTSRAVKRLNIQRLSIDEAFSRFIKKDLDIWIGVFTTLVEQDGVPVIYKTLTPPLHVIEYRNKDVERKASRAHFACICAQDETFFGEHFSPKRIINVPTGEDALALLRDEPIEASYYGLDDGRKSSSSTHAGDGLSRTDTGKKSAKLGYALTEDANIHVRNVAKELEAIVKRSWPSASTASDVLKSSGQQ